MNSPGEREEERLWLVKETAQYLRKSESWVYKQVALKKIPHRKVGRDVRFSPAAIKAWFESQPGGG